MATQKKRFHPKKWAGVYVYETSTMHAGAPDVCFYIKAMLKYSVTLFTKFTTPLQFLLYVIMNEAKSEMNETINRR